MRFLVLALLLSVWSSKLWSDNLVFIPRSWMMIGELLDEAERQSGYEIENLITDTQHKMVLYDALTKMEDVIDATREYYEYVLRTDVEVIREGRKIIFRRPLVREVRPQEPQVVSSWPKALTGAGKDYPDILGAEDGSSPGNFWQDGVVKSQDDEEGFLLIDRTGDKQAGFSMTPGKGAFPRDNTGWNEDRIDSLFKPRRIVDLRLNSQIDEIVPMQGEGADTVKEGVLDLEVLGESHQEISDFENPSEGFAMPTDSMLRHEPLPSHPKDSKRKPKWILSLRPEKWLPNFEPYRHPEEVEEPVSRRVLNRRDRGRAYFESEREAYYEKRRAEDSRRPRRILR